MSAGDDPRHYAQLLSAVYDAAMAGDKMPARPRSLISESWDRVLTAGVDPEVGRTDVGLDVSELEERRAVSGLTAVLDDLTRGLDSVIADGDNILVVADAEGRVLWRSGASRVLQRADRLGFVEGAGWAENAVGTNAIGTALMSGRAVQVFSAEHFVRSHHSWTCAGAPIRDPRTGTLLGVVDVSGPAATIHPTTVALVDVVAKLAESQLRDHHRRSLDQLRSVAAPMLARSGGPALAVDNDGWVAALDAVAPRARLTLPRHAGPGRVWLRSLGDCDLEPLPGGWLVRVAERGSSSDTTVDLDLRDPRKPSLTVSGGTGQWTMRPSPRHAEILTLLAQHRGGRSAAQMSRHLFGTDDRTITVRAEMSRLRKHLGGLLAAHPYRFADGVTVRVDRVGAAS
ncbi:helix-turn-helix domain-containing protein [Gordonia hankookensis]|uniref:GAF domain-containing protein n=1 Tax=Gordonia hankookensis TaxID=589403 RepID=A0ABR7WFS6_9ACTN|nr:helix-turn-helix domain-containing protein [Gordonia hankookensis]MBD1321525.1 GAF domain-containing protein [Gordonia hankookensis]